MKTLIVRSRSIERPHLRPGFLATREVLLILIILVGVTWAIASLLAVVAHESNAAAAERGLGVYRIWLEPNERHVSVYRPNDGVVQLNLSTGDLEKSLPVYDATFAEVARSSDGTTTLTCQHDGTMMLRRDGDDDRVAQIALANSQILDAHVTDDGNVALCVADYGRVHGWSRSGTDVREFTYELSPKTEIIHSGVNVTGHRLFVVRSDGTLSFHSTETGIRDQTELHVGAECSGFVWSRDENFFISISFDRSVRIYDLRTGRVVKEGPLDTQQQSDCGKTAVKMSPNGRLIAVPTTGYTIIIWDLNAAAPVGELRGHQGIIPTLQFSRNSDRLFSGSYDDTVREWSLDTFSQLRIVN